MKRLRQFLRHRSRGVAAVEFALAAPVMLIFLGGLIDYGLAFYDKDRLNAGISAGAEYAVLNASSLISSGAAGQTTIQSLVKNASGLTGVTATVTGLSPTACYCVSGTPPATASATCGSTCSNGAPAGTYVFITASYTYTSMLPHFSGMSSSALSQSATVQIQ